MTTKDGWKKAVAEEKLKEGVMFAARVGKQALILTRKEGRINAMGGKCSHYGAPLEEGLLLGHILTCPWHTARFDIRTGKVKAPPALNDLARYETKVEAGDVYGRRVQAETLSIPRGKDDGLFSFSGRERVA